MPRRTSAVNGGIGSVAIPRSYCETVVQQPNRVAGAGLTAGGAPLDLLRPFGQPSACWVTQCEYLHGVARSDLLKALLRSYQRGDDAAFQRAAKELIDNERRKRQDLVAEQLEAILEEPGHRRRPPQVSSLRPLPKTRDGLPLISLQEPGVSFHDLVLPDSVVSVFESLVEEFRQ